MNGLILLGMTCVIFVIAYLFYGHYLVKTWGIDEKAKTPACEKEDGVDYVPSNKWEVFAHQFSSIAGAGPVTGPVMAMMFGWLPAFLWIVIGGILCIGKIKRKIYRPDYRRLYRKDREKTVFSVLLVVYFACYCGFC